VSEPGDVSQIEALGNALAALPAELPTELPPVPLLATPDAGETAVPTSTAQFQGKAEPLREPSAAPDPLLAIGAQLEALTREVAGFNERFSAQQALLSRAHDEIERLREGDRRGLLQPLLREVMALRSDLLLQARTLPAEYSAEQAAKLLESFASSVEQTLGRFGVEPFAPTVGDDVNFREHRRVGTIATGDETLHGKIGGVRTDGYWDVELGRQLAHAEVLVFALNPDPTAGTGEPVNSSYTFGSDSFDQGA